MAEQDFQVPSSPNPNDTAALIQGLRSLVVDCPDLRRLEQSLGRFNIFDVLRSTHTEIRHSNVLAWLFDPAESHGLREFFLRRFLMRVFHENQQEEAANLDPVEVDSMPFRSVRVHREWKNIDVLIEILTKSGRKWVICLENKVWARQGAGQLSGYRKTVEAAFPEAERIYLFLTVRGDEPEDPAYILATYEQVAGVLDACLAENEGALGEGPELLMRNYSTILKERFMDDPEAIKLALKIYGAHKRAIDFINEHLPDPMQLITDRLVALLELNKKNLGLVSKQIDEGIVRFVPKAWELRENSGDDGWSTIRCEITLERGGKAYLKVFIRPEGPQAWRDALFTMANKENFPNTVRKNRPPPEWFPFYVCQLPEWGDRNEDLETIGEGIWAKCEEEMNTKRFETMVGLVADMMTSLPGN